jgi:NADPH:quinone reductase-like Zn-dependent oxidoreductase
MCWVRVHAAALNPADWHILRGDPLVARLMGVGLTKPKARVAGIDAAGVVKAADANVSGLRSGYEVLGSAGARSRRSRAAADLVVAMPASLAFEQAAAVPIAATTALRGIRDVGQVRAGQRVLVNGAGGGVGSYAVQIAAALGAEVTGPGNGLTSWGLSPGRSVSRRGTRDVTPREIGVRNSRGWWTRLGFCRVASINARWKRASGSTV